MLKRFFDIVASFSGLLILSPIIAIVAWQISRKLGSPVLFRQASPGLHGKPFEMVKFRTMRDAFDENGKPLPDSERITPFGRILRSTSLDELPGLWNVLKGDMSVVGPRPSEDARKKLLLPHFAHSLLGLLMESMPGQSSVAHAESAE